MVSGEQTDPISSRNWAIEEWLTRLAGAIELMTEGLPETIRGERLTVGDLDAKGAVAWHFLSLSVSEDSVLFAGATDETCIQIGKAALQAAGLAEIDPADARNTYLEILSQATSGLAMAIGKRLGKEITASEPVSLKPGPDPNLDLTPIDVVLKNNSSCRLFIGLAVALEAALDPPAGSEKDQEVDKADPTQSIEPAVRNGPQKPKTFDLLMEVELPVSVSFGRTALPLRDVLKLNSGSIVELNRTLTDPVEIIVNNCVIARGEVVVVDGNYGVRIQQVVSREERLRTLK